MPIEFRCKQCNKLLRTGDDTVGKQAKCPECGAVMPVPMPDSAQGSANPPMASPFAPASTPAPDSMNPYQSPAGAATEATFFAPPDEIRPTRIDFNQTLARTWAVFSDRWLTVLGGLFLAGLISIPPYAALMFVHLGIVRSIGNPVVALTVYLLAQVAFQIFVFWIMIGIQLFTLAVVRGEEPRYGLIFAGGRYLLSIILCGILTTLVVMAGFVMLVVPGLIFAMMLLQAQLLIIDRNLGVLDAMSTSRDVMAGNKLTVLAIMIITGIVGSIFCGVTCGLGVFAYAPYAILLTIVIYLGVTGQPTLADRYMMPTEQPGRSPFGVPNPAVPPGDSPFAS